MSSTIFSSHEQAVAAASSSSSSVSRTDVSMQDQVKAASILQTDVSPQGQAGAVATSSSSVSPVSHNHSSSLPQASFNSSSQHICSSIRKNETCKNKIANSLNIRNSYSPDVSDSNCSYQVHNSIASQSHAVAGTQNINSRNVSQISRNSDDVSGKSSVSHAGTSL